MRSFGEATIHFTDKIDLTLGLRQHDQSGYSVNKSFVASAPHRSRSIRISLHVGDPVRRRGHRSPPTRRSSSTS